MNNVFREDFCSVEMKGPGERRQKVERFITIHLVDGSETRKFRVLWAINNAAYTWQIVRMPFLQAIETSSDISLTSAET